MELAREGEVPGNESGKLEKKNQSTTQKRRKDSGSARHDAREKGKCDRSKRSIAAGGMREIKIPNRWVEDRLKI